VVVLSDFIDDLVVAFEDQKCTATSLAIKQDENNIE
jgi:hypothetical protein